MIFPMLSTYSRSSTTISNNKIAFDASFSVIDHFLPPCTVLHPIEPSCEPV